MGSNLIIGAIVLAAAILAVIGAFVATNMRHNDMSGRNQRHKRIDLFERNHEEEG